MATSSTGVGIADSMPQKEETPEEMAEMRDEMEWTITL